ncbi:MAG TPA: hypothetical protein VEC16_02910, partial [Alphaproteobacteria bacterium]|nr:hypothetical protein [Alphaproteobacteria bacterium]
VIEKVRSSMNKLGWLGAGKKISFIKVLVNDAQDYLKNEDYDKAALIYREIKLSYEEANDYIRREVYDESFGLCNELDFRYALKVLDKADYYIKSGDRNSALIEFEKLEKTYSKLSDDYRSQIHDKFRKVADQISANTRFN